MDSHERAEPSGKAGSAGSAGFHPSGRQVVGAIVAVLLVVFIAANSTNASVNFIIKTVSVPMWVVLAGTALLGVGIGMLLGTRRTKRKYARSQA